MKRSEIVLIIAKELHMRTNFLYIDTQIDRDTLQFADDLLLMLEHKGMLPPLIEKMEDGRFVGSSSALYPEWEDE